nr:type 2 lanthipeptide synthetase LanM [uncultured Schaedlerella sp.]
MDCKMWERLLGKEIYAEIEPASCEALKEKLYRQCSKALLRIYEAADRHYAGGLEDVNFENFYRFFLQIALDYGKEKAGREHPFGREEAVMVTGNVLTGVLHIPVRCLIEDIQECREGKMLSGRDEWEEYRDYDEHFLGRPEYIRELCGRYPELLRLVLRRIEQIVDQLFRVWEAVEGRFSPVKAESVELGISDVHTGGRTAARIRLADGRSFIYKPRSLHKDRIYQGISRWFCKRLGLSFREREIYEMEGCGLDSCIECAPCLDKSEIKRFFYRLGIQLFICYLTDTSDIHGENLIANGEFPELIDLEAMPGAAGRREAHSDGGSTCSGSSDEGSNGGTHMDLFSDRCEASDMRALREWMEKSVTHTGILPTACWGNDAARGSVNALHSAEKCVTPFLLPTVTNPRSSRMKLAYERREIHLKNSVPVYQGKPAEVQRYVEELCEGFGAAFEIACNEKEQIRSLFEPLYSEEGRFLIRHTQQYGMYLTASLAPEFMKDARNRIYLLHILKKGQKSETGYAALFAYELEAMMNMEIPIYYFRGKGKELLDGAQKAYPEYFEQSAYESFQEKLQRLSAAELGRQQMLIRLSIGCSLPRTEESGFLSTEVIRGKGAQGNVFTRLGRHLAGLRIEAGGRQIWTRTDFSGQAWGMKAAGMDLYDGIPGIAAALAAVISAGGSREFDSLFDRLTDDLFCYTERCLESKQTVSSGQTGMFAGEGSVVYAYLLLYRLTGRRQYLDYADRHVRIVRAAEEQDTSYDLLSGNAGWIVVLLKLYQETKEEAYLSYAVRAGELLWEKRTVMETGCGWLCASEKAPLAGMAHGNSGAVLAYARLMKYTKAPEYAGRLRQILEYEDSLYLEKERNWKDLRSRENRGSHTNAWCHGGSGILLSRLSLLELEGFQEDKRVARDIERGTACLMRWKKDSSICLCHGLAGKYMILCEAAKALGRDELRKESAKIRRRILELERVPVQEYYNASLMAGISGAALALCEADAELLY